MAPSGRVNAAERNDEGTVRPAAAAPATRLDLARIYLRVDRAFDAHPPRGEALVETARQFDVLTSRFLMRRVPESLQGLQDLAHRLEKNRDPTPAESLAGALRVRIDPPVWTLGSDEPPVALASLLYDPPAPSTEQETAIRVVLEGPGDAQSIAITLPAGMTAGGPESRGIDSPNRVLQPGPYFMTVHWPTGLRSEAGKFYVVEKPLDEERLAHESRLRAAAQAHPERMREIEICRSRNALLTDRPSEDSISALMMDPLELRAEVRAEIGVLERGESPYERRAGAYWRMLGGAEIPVPMWVLAPPAEGPQPLVVALHGAGANEGIFLFAYGNGELGLLAEEHGFLLACPATLPFAANPGNLDRLIDDLSRDYPVDRSRVYMLGHSLGGIATAGFIAGAGEHLAAACGIAGFRGVRPGAKAPPTLVIAAENDPIVPATMVHTAAERSKAAGLDVEYRVVADYGHTFIVGHVLPGVVDWLMTHRKSAAAP